jgi:hypothetical protein
MITTVHKVAPIFWAMKWRQWLQNGYKEAALFGGEELGGGLAWLPAYGVIPCERACHLLEGESANFTLGRVTRPARRGSLLTPPPPTPTPHLLGQVAAA